MRCALKPNTAPGVRCDCDFAPQVGWGGLGRTRDGQCMAGAPDGWGRAVWGRGCTCAEARLSQMTVLRKRVRILLALPITLNVVADTLSSTWGKMGCARRGPRGLTRSGCLDSHGRGGGGWVGVDV